MNTNDVINKFYGIKSYDSINPITDTVLTSITQLLPFNPSRLALTIINLGTNNVYISFTNDPASTKGIFLAPNGGSISIDFTTSFNTPTNNIYAIATTASSAVYIVEQLISPMV